VSDPIPIIGGTGALGYGLAVRWAQAGRRIVIGSRKADRAVEAAEKITAEASALSRVRLAQRRWKLRGGSPTLPRDVPPTGHTVASFGFGSVKTGVNRYFPSRYDQKGAFFGSKVRDRFGPGS
jgi:hypothetical protein